MEEDSEEHYKTLLNDIWRKGFPLVTGEERHKLLNGRPANDAELAAMHARLTEIKEALNRVKVTIFVARRIISSFSNKFHRATHLFL